MEAVLSRHKAQCGNQMSLAHAGRAEEDHIFSVFQEAHGGQFIDLTLVDGGLEGEIEVVQSLLDGKSRHLDLLFVGSFPYGVLIADAGDAAVFLHPPEVDFVDDVLSGEGSGPPFSVVQRESHWWWRGLCH